MLENPFLIVICQSIVSAFSWWFFAISLSSRINVKIYKKILITTIILFSFSYSLIMWNNAIESESYCISSILILIAMIFSKNKYNFFKWSLSLIFFIFTRDTNVYLLPFLMPLIFYKLHEDKPIILKLIIMSAFLVAINLTMCLNSKTRSGAPIKNNYQSRIFLNSSLTEYFHLNYNMPVPDFNKYIGNTYKDFNLLSDNAPESNLYYKNTTGYMNTLKRQYPNTFTLWSIYYTKIASDIKFDIWFNKYGKKSYINYLIINNFFLKDVFTKYYNYIFFVPSFSNNNYIFNPSYTNGLSYILIVLGIILNNLFTSIVLLLLGCIVSIFKYKTLNVSMKLILIDLLLVIGFLSNSIIAFWGSGMEFSRHCLIPSIAINLIIVINSIYICYYSSIVTAT